MNGNLVRSLACTAGFAVALVVSLTSGCAASRPRAAADRARIDATRRAPSAAEEKRTASSCDQEGRATREAQRAWCGYLEALYLRVNEGASGWPRREECSSVETTAGPRMLLQAADCARRALDAFPGDPFTPAYASQVGSCGIAAIDAAAVTSEETAPFIAALCGRAASCGASSEADCRASVPPVLALNIERAVGAMNQQGRAELRICLRASPCDELDDRVSTCLEPLLDRLLWLPR